MATRYDIIERVMGSAVDLGYSSTDIPDDFTIPSCTIEDVDRSLFDLFNEGLPLFYTFKKTQKVLKNMEIKDKNIINNINIKNSIKAAEKLMKGQGRILVRASGTESKIRVMGESDNNKLLQNCLNIILKKIK